MRSVTVEINKELSDMIQSRQFELESLKNLLGFAYSTTEYSIPEQRIALLEERFNSITTEYTLLKNQVEELVVPKDYDKLKTNWNLDFASNTVTVTEND